MLTENSKIGESERNSVTKTSNLNKKKNYKPLLIIDEMPKKTKSDADWIALLLLGFGILAISKQNNAGFIFIVLALTKYFWTL